MEPKVCMNVACRATATQEWKKGWTLRSGSLADLCYNCGSAYENSVFCHMFHQAETGWRECSICGKKIHCGCVASKFLFEHLDFGGIGCASCAKSSQARLIARCKFSNGSTTFAINNRGSLTPIKKEVNDKADDRKLTELCGLRDIDASSRLSQSPEGIGASVRKINGEAVSPVGQAWKGFIDESQQQSGGSPRHAHQGTDRQRIASEELNISAAQPSFSISLGAHSRTSNMLPSSSDTREGSSGPSSYLQGQKSHPILLQPPNAEIFTSAESNQSMVSQIPTARPPAEGRGKTQLLPRYWPRISEQEVQQLSAHLNCTVVPLFEKVLSASDAGRIGRLVLPKACAEAYFPHITHSDGISVNIQDVKGKEWTFQFRFWPNNNSRMYVLEGVTPCIQSMQLIAGDTVIFSRKDPGNKLVIGFRKAANSGVVQDSQTSDLSTVNGHAASTRSENNASGPNEDLRLQSVPSSEKKRSKNIGSKSKRLLIHSEDALEIRLTWEDAQDLLRPPPSVKPSIVTIEDHEFEEYEEPPVFGKRTIFGARSSGGHEQWAQCDDCSKWRRLPADVLLPSRWTCSDNAWDLSRGLCSVPSELSPKEVDRLLRMTRDFKKRKIADSHKTIPDREPSGLDALASAAVLGESMGDGSEPSVGATTKHPRHRAGCSCIVCSQPPSGKGKHKSSCTCNVCMTVKRRFKTLMLNKKKRQSEREADIAQKDQHGKKVKSEMNGPSTHPTVNDSGNGSLLSNIQPKMPQSSNGQLDLNCHPDREDTQSEVQEVGIVDFQLADHPSEKKPVVQRVGMTDIQVADHPLEKQAEVQGVGTDVQVADHRLEKQADVQGAGADVQVADHPLEKQAEVRGVGADVQVDVPGFANPQTHGESERGLLDEGATSSTNSEHGTRSKEGTG